MQYLLEYSTNPFIVAGIAITTLVLLHVLFVWKYPLTARQWKLAEYVWVTLALMSIIGLWERARELKSETDVNRTREITEQKLAALEHWFEVYSDYGCEMAEGVSKESSVPQTTALCKWASGKETELQLVTANEVFPPDVPQNLLIGIDEIEEGLGLADRAMIETHLTSYREARQAYLIAETEARHSASSSLFVSLAPLLFALAAALKFTKVSGEYMLMRKK